MGIRTVRHCPSAVRSSHSSSTTGERVVNSTTSQNRASGIGNGNGWTSRVGSVRNTTETSKWLLAGHYPDLGYLTPAPIVGRVIGSLKNSPYSVRYEEFLAALGAAREQAGLTQAELAARLNKPQSYVSKCESGERRLDVIEFEIWCQALKIDAAAFMASF
ncbi:MAG: helix-turn-helix transcriptional regulator [Ramlibacter sp.]|nr:helix-turn-helix transcriptional regulator [Ramlibacter sp.]